MLERAIRSVQERGLVATALRAAEICKEEVLRPKHISEHLLVPIEMAKHPSHAYEWFRDRVDKQQAVTRGVPWISWPCIDHLNAYLKPEHKVFEWGGGGSTVFFLDKGCKVTTVESNDYWRERIVSRVSGSTVEHWDLRYIPADSNQDPRAIDYINSVKTGGPWDVVLVDGWNRFRCLETAKDYVVRGGLLILDNADQAQYNEVPEKMRPWQRLEFRGLGPGRTWVTKTDAYVKP